MDELFEYLREHGEPVGLKAFYWLLPRINIAKLVERSRYAYENDNETVKCVLAEYVYTSKQHVKQGYPNHVEYMPYSRVLVHHAFSKPKTLEFLGDTFHNGSSNCKIYTRQKINYDGSIDIHRRQIVLMYEPWSDASTTSAESE
jgi:hypothetical protein